MPSTIPYPHSLPVRRSRAPQGTEASIPVLDVPRGGTLAPAGTLPSPGVPKPSSAVEVLRPDFGRTRAKDTVALRALAARVLPVLERREAFAPVVPLRPANDVRLSAAPGGTELSLAPRAPNPWSLVVARVAGAASNPPTDPDPRSSA